MYRDVHRDTPNTATNLPWHFEVSIVFVQEYWGKHVVATINKIVFEATYGDDHHVTVGVVFRALTGLIEGLLLELGAPRDWQGRTRFRFNLEIPC